VLIYTSRAATRSGRYHADRAAAALDPGRHSRWQLSPAEANGARYLKVPVKLTS